MLENTIEATHTYLVVNETSLNNSTLKTACFPIIQKVKIVSTPFCQMRIYEKMRL